MQAARLKATLPLRMTRLHPAVASWVLCRRPTGIDAPATGKRLWRALLARSLPPRERAVASNNDSSVINDLHVHSKRLAHAHPLTTNPVLELKIPIQPGRAT